MGLYTSFIAPNAESANKPGYKIGIIFFLVGVILCLHYFTSYNLKNHHSVYRMLFYFPLILGSFWFGLRGAVLIALSVSILFFPFLIINWQGFSYEDFDKILEGFLYITMAFVLGILVERRSKRQQAYLQRENLAAVGSAVAEIGHDMKTPLMAIGGFTNQICKTLDEGDPNRKKLKIVMVETARLDAMIREMLLFSGKIELKIGEVHINDLVREALNVVQPEAERRMIYLTRDLSSSVPIVLVDGNKVKQVILNLIANAIQASPTGGEVTIRTRVFKNGISVDVIDCGCGVDKRESNRIFDPFFTTKRGGSGLGLAIVKKIVEAHRGYIFFSPNHKAGVTFTVTFPYKERLSR
jgi:signal transduction histidine kinase